MDTQLPSAHERRSVQRIDRPIELAQLPVIRVESGHKVAGTIIALVGGLVVLSIMGILSGDFSFWGLFTPVGLVGVVIFLGGVHLAIMGMAVTLDEERVAVRTRGLLGRKAWSEALASYRGVMLRSKWVTGGRDQHTYQVFLVELQHVDPKKTVAVFIPSGLPIAVAVFLLAAFGLAAALTVALFFVGQPRIQIGRETVVATNIHPGVNTATRRSGSAPGSTGRIRRGPTRIPRRSA